MTIRSKVFIARKFILSFLLKKAGFIIVRGHWVYSNEINRNSKVIDLGANKGEFSIAIYNQFRARCAAIEPNKFLYDQIETDHIAKFNLAATKEDGIFKFYISDNVEASSILPTLSNRWNASSETVVEGLTWRSLLKKLKLEKKVIDLIKIDIEGAELDVIESFTLEDLERIKQITVEFHDWLDIGLHERTLKSIDKLKKFGFDAFTDAPDHTWPVEMLFLNKKLVNKSKSTTLFLQLFNLLSFRRY